MSVASDRLAVRVLADYLNSKHIDNLIGDFNAIATVANEVAADTVSRAATQAAIEATYALNLALGISAYGVGTEQFDLIRINELGSAAFVDLDALLARQPNLQNGSYQFTVLDRLRMTYCTSGTNTWTLPLASSLPEGWHAPFRNRSGNNLTLAREATLADTINGAAASLTVATGAATSWIWRVTSTAFEVG